jgi:hypothetical protein
MARIVRIRYLLAAGLSMALVAGAMTLFASVGSADPSTPGGALGWSATVTDNSSGTTYGFSLNANESTTTAGKGGVDLALGGPSLSLCTAHATAPLTSGSFPYQNVQCGGAGNQSVAIDGCVATIRAHGFVHSDDPNSNVLDGMTVAIRFQKTGPASANFDATISTVAKKVDIHGKATSGAPIFMSTCP